MRVNHRRGGGVRRGRCAVSFLLLLCAASPVLAQSAEERRYGACLGDAESDPAAAFEAANRWAAEGGGLPARHCAAVALVRTRNYAPAALALEKLATEARMSRPERVVDLLAQAAQAWHLAGEIDRGLALQDRAITLAPADLEVRLDRALARAAAGRHFDAIDDCDLVLARAPRRADVWLIRAGSWRALGQHDLAADDVDRALAIAPESLEALTERAEVRRAQNNRLGARADALAVLRRQTEGPLAERARGVLEAIDVKVDARR